MSEQNNKYNYDMSQLVGIKGPANHDEIMVSASDSMGLIKSSGKKLSDLQEKLVSGESIKTINGESILGTGDLPIGGGSSGQVVFDNDIYIDASMGEIYEKQSTLPIFKDDDGYHYWFDTDIIGGYDAMRGKQLMLNFTNGIDVSGWRVDITLSGTFAEMAGMGKVIFASPLQGGDYGTFTISFTEDFIMQVDVTDAEAFGLFSNLMSDCNHLKITIK